MMLGPLPQVSCLLAGDLDSDKRNQTKQTRRDPCAREVKGWESVGDGVHGG